MINTASQTDAQREESQIARLRAACAIIVQAVECYRPKAPREQTVDLAKLIGAYIEQMLSQYTQAADPEAFVAAIEQKAKNEQDA